MDNANSPASTCDFNPLFAGSGVLSRKNQIDCLADLIKHAQKYDLSKDYDGEEGMALEQGLWECIMVCTYGDIVDRVVLALSKISPDWKLRGEAYRAQREKMIAKINRNMGRTGRLRGW